MSKEVGFFVFVEAKPIHRGRSFRYNTTVTLIDPPDNDEDLKTAIWLKVADRNPGYNVKIISFTRFAQ